MSKQKVTLRIEEGEVELLKRKFRTDNQSEAIRLAIIQSLATEDLKKVKTLFPYIGKKPPRIGREVVNAFEQSGCKVFIEVINHQFNWWFDISPPKGYVTARPKGRYRKHFYWSAIKRYFWNLLFSILLPALLYIFELPHL